MASRWIRLDTTWSTSEWLVDMDPAARLCWVELLCYVKAHGTAGRAKRIPPSAAARSWGVTRNDVTAMEEAAISDGALEVDEGEWVVTAWAEYQRDSTAAERMRRYRQRQQEDTEPSTDRDDTDVTRNERNVTAYIDRDRDKDSNSSLGASSDAPTPSLRERFPAKPPKDGSGGYVYPAEFEAAWKEYPDRQGGNPKVGAYKAWRARVIDGSDPDLLTKAARHYRLSAAAAEKEATEFVQHAATFFGAKEPWREFIEEPKLNGSGKNHWALS